MKKAACVLSVAGLLGACFFAAPQSAQAVWFNPVGIGAYGALGGGWGGYGYGYGGGTVAGSYMQGMSSVIQAQGEYNESTSRAMINYQEASSKYADNVKKWNDTYYHIREQNDKKTAEKLARDRISPEVLAQAARSALPRPLSSEAFDSITGKINWPDLLQTDIYAQPRQEIDRLLELHASTSGAGTGPRFQQAVARMTEILKSNIRNLPANEYIAARKFLDSLAFTVSRA